MLVTTTDTLEGRRIVSYKGLVTGETIIGANFIKDFFASLSDKLGGRSGSYERVIREAKETATREMVQQARRKGANAVIAVDLDFESIALANGNSMLMVTASGTAVIVQEYQQPE